MSDSELLAELIKVSPETPMLGECHTSTFIHLSDGKILRFGITDEDVAEQQGLWVKLVNKKEHKPIYK